MLPSILSKLSPKNKIMQHGCTWNKFSFKPHNINHDVAIELAVEVHQPAQDKVHTVLIVCHGRERDAMQILRQARQNLSDENVLIIAPKFLNGTDSANTAGQASNLLIWRGNDWGEGGPSKSTAGSPITSFEVLDAIISYYSDPTRFTRLKKVVLVGHSLGGQLVQRYSVLGKATKHAEHLEPIFVVMNPSTYLYLRDDIPYKYGLAGRQKAFAHYSSAASISTQELTLRFRQRKVHYLHGERDLGTGDERPLAMAQGRNRFERSQNWCNHLHSLVWPATHTFAYVPNVGHDAGKMMASSHFKSIL
ncbi:uncharacterized protein FA14DRAFT_156886 [Meira miltonrushii]|uniref:AB hydrolase-1 domain-containing protein n=1 Tax=Meira miltonrushii TaxID=1280837 RepID=A0A316V9S7_9BASI|nr:uncharacterized protein FA14DRAFT_156886 [Meira miltonrushii]PWN34222.1 hypothetical protein FA14DRAFT_156886 [Meira miltonrushii]